MNEFTLQEGTIQDIKNGKITAVVMYAGGVPLGETHIRNSFSGSCEPCVDVNITAVFTTEVSHLQELPLKYKELTNALGSEKWLEKLCRGDVFSIIFFERLKKCEEWCVEYHCQNCGAVESFGPWESLAVALQRMESMGTKTHTCARGETMGDTGVLKPVRIKKEN